MKRSFIFLLFILQSYPVSACEEPINRVPGKVHTVITVRKKQTDALKKKISETKKQPVVKLKMGIQN